ncbi:hypothetical protein CY34DRAFT_814519 [Suillus luteus UH-Slu-Lm8-n1]|uniref:Uncharacterized protein n=1 Tax=Suillus luteus UH-Slu-Lm8-n1 TaxID=930992 RepID=A0A0D0AIE5_9AGAM|nr:hypothetical protein CY34DRAFT_814519 [Suillus luteus UH-Slu-Lm8-n1]
MNEGPHVELQEEVEEWLVLCVEVKCMSRLLILMLTTARAQYPVPPHFRVGVASIV